MDENIKKCFEATVETTTTTQASESPPTSSTQKLSSTSPTPNGKVKALQQQQHHQFRTPQQFVKHRRSSNSALSKKNKTWNKRQNKIGKQQQQLQTHSNAAFSSGGNSTNISGGASNLSTSVGGGGGLGGLPPGKADLENIQNVKSQLVAASNSGASYHNTHHAQAHSHHPHSSHGGHHSHYSGVGHRLASNSGALVGNIVTGCGQDCRNAAAAAANSGGSNVSVNLHSSASLEKICYGPGHHHLNKQLYKKIVAHRGHYHNHILCAGAAHNTHGSSGPTSGVCCLLHNCSTQNGCKDKESSNSHASSTSSVSGGAACSALHYCCGRAKFFLPDKRLRKEIIVPPTKFLLGGNISDPLNLNSLQNDSTSSNNTPATTPRRSPITTPPKVEVIIPPNIHDPLHLLDPVDSMEYEKQLTSPLKRHSRGGQMLLNKPYKPGRNRKNRKRRRHDSYGSTISSLDGVPSHTDISGGQLSTETLGVSGEAISADIHSELAQSADDDDECKIEKVHTEWTISALSIESVSANESTSLTQLTTSQLREEEEKLPESENVVSQSTAEYTGPVTRERANRDLRLELNLTSSTTNSTCGSVTGLSIQSSISGHWGASGGRGRKRKTSESNNSLKNKKHRDSLDKIVSPVVPQPGAWKRPPRQSASGARKPTRRSTSVSESELLSPADDALKHWPVDGNNRNVNTPDNSKYETTSELGQSSPQSTISGCTTVAGAEHDLPKETATTCEISNTNDSSIKTTEAQPILETVPAAMKSAAQNQTTTSAATKDDDNLLKFRIDGHKYRYGNYDRYKGVRQLNEFIDVRLHIFSRNTELFQNKDILDIGCNTGQMTISVARDLAPKSILGIDIDKELIKRARRNVSMFVRIPQENFVAKQAEQEESVKAEMFLKKEKMDIEKETKEVKEATLGNVLQAADSTTTEPLPLHLLPKKKHKNRKGKKQRLAAAARAAARQPATAAHLMHHHHLLHHHHHHEFHHLNNNWHPGHPNSKRLHINANELFPISFPLCFGGLDKFGLATPPVSSVCSDTKSPASRSTPGHAANASGINSVSNDFPRNVFFRQTNYILKDESQLSTDTQQYDLILCLSVTKWIHLNFGDAGLKLAFKRMFNQLRPGGKLILEAQNWASYKKKSNLTPDIHKNYQTIEFFPNKFHEYLLSSEVGFSHSYTLGVPRHLNKGFGRPIQLYAKGDYTPNHVRWSDAYYPNTPFEEYRGIYAFMPPRSGAYAWNYAKSSTRSQTYETPHHVSGGASGPYSCRQTPVYHPTYNPLETDSYQPSYDMEYMNHLDVFGSPGSPLYQTVWSPPASLRNSSSHTPVYGSVREAELDGEVGGQYRRHVYPPNDDTFSPNANAGGAFNSIRDPDTDDSAGNTAVQHVYATHCGESSSSPQVLRPESEMIDETLISDDDVISRPNTNAVSSSFVNEQE